MTVADYDVVDELGRGPQGTSYRARPPARLSITDDVVVVKALDQRADDEVFERVAYELSVFGAVGSSYLVPLLEVGVDDGRLWYSSVLVEGGSLPTDPDPDTSSRSRRIRAVADGARGAHHLHEHGVVHRGIKPQNLLDGDGRWKLADLDLGHLLSPGQSVTAAGLTAALEFVDPDVIRGERAGRASDIWSLGATLHRALTGRSVYPGLTDEAPAAAVRHVLSTPPVLDDSLSPTERAAILGCLDEDRSARSADALVVAQLLDDLAEEA